MKQLSTIYHLIRLILIKLANLQMMLVNLELAVLEKVYRFGETFCSQMILF